jgi:hypothetical protein
MGRDWPGGVPREIHGKAFTRHRQEDPGSLIPGLPALGHK